MQNRQTWIWIILIVVGSLSGILSPASAESSKNKFLKAQACHQKLLQNPKIQQYRDRWLICIETFQDVYRSDPSGPWAAAGLYNSGHLYAELYKRSFKASDRKEALDAFERIISRYPKSRYKGKAQAELSALNERKVKRRSVPPKPKIKPPSEKAFQRARDNHKKLLANPSKQKYRDKWLACIKSYQDIYQAALNGPHAAASLYYTGELYRGLYKKSYLKSDKDNARDAFEDVIRSFPDSIYRPKAEKALGRKATAISQTDSHSDAPAEHTLSPEERKQIALDRIADLIKSESESRTKDDQPAPTTMGHPGRIVIHGLRYWSNPSYTRIVIDADGEAAFTHRLLKKDPAIKKPQRLYIDLEKSILGKNIQKYIPINDNLLIDARAGQYTSKSVRVVVDIKSFKTYKIFSLKNPFRIVLDVWGMEKDTPVKSPPSPSIADGGGKFTNGALARQLALGVQRIVIDPGHGGRDYGAPGRLKGVHEKRVVLAIAKKLARKIHTQLGCETILTRSSDRFLSLEERTAIANTKNADLFISIHTNAAKDKRAYGIETFFLNLATDDEAIRVAARENATSTKNISDLESILNDLMQNAKINESSRLAGHVHHSLVGHMKKTGYKYIRSKGVKQAPFYVLMGAQMPAILIETSFISNARDCKRLTDPKYQEALCEGIIKGIRQYIKEINPTALYRMPSKKGHQG
jgi:N-acetylmuramoyl-L-alanine amidase